VIDDFLSAEELGQLGLAHLGREVRISRHALLFGTERMWIGDHCRIDAFTVLSAGHPHLKLGRNVHLSVRVSILGQAAFEIGDFSGLSVGTTVLTSSDTFTGDWLYGPTIPEELRETLDAPVSVGARVVVGAHCILLPGVTIGEGAAVAAASLVKADVPAFTLVGGVPARFLRAQGRASALLAQRLAAEEAPDR
jgi:dTDP-4-amino-4,6-dideoxy-D-glucose acyltransferase